MAPKTLLLVGGGHAHIQVVTDLSRLPDARLILVSDDDNAVYSGMLPSVVAGLRPAADALVNLPQLCERHCWRFIRGRVVQIAPHANSVTVQPAALGAAAEPLLTVPYDVLSLDIGSTTRAIPGLTRGAAETAAPRVPMAVATRPIGRLARAVEQFERALRALPAATSAARTVLVVGGGAAGVELAFALEARLRRALRDVCATNVVLARAADALGKQGGRMLARTVRAQLRARGIAQVAARAVAVDEAAGVVRFDDGSARAYDLLVAATGAAAHPWLRSHSGLALDDRGFILVGPTLSTAQFPNVFAAGDCASFGARFGDQFPPKAGVYAVRQGPVLAHNLREAIAGTGAPARAYKPQASFLSLLATGDGRAIGSKHGLAFSGTWVYHLKSHIDEAWQARFQVQAAGKQKRSEECEKLAEFSGSPSEGAACLLAASDVATSDAFDVQLAVLRRMDADPAFRDKLVEFVASKE